VSGHDLDVVIDGVVAGGDGLAREAGGRVVFIAGALPGERVLARFTEQKKGFARAALTEVVEPSPDRVTPPCPHVADGCGGCGWQHVAPDAQRALKVDIVADALRRIGKVEVPPIDHGAPLSPIGYRTTVRVAVQDGRPAFRHARSHDLVPVERCLVAHPLIDELIAEGRFGDASEVELRCGAGTGERLAVVHPSVDEGVVLPADVTVVGADELRRGRRAWFHEVVGGCRWRISAGSFFQTRTDGAESLVAAVRAAVGTMPESMADLYCGVGLFAGLLTAGRVIAVDSSRSAIHDARHNLDAAQRRGVTVVHADVDAWKASPVDVVVADPSRAGLGRKAAGRVAATRAGLVVLVSCDAAALGRDAGLLAAHGYRLAGVTLVDLFPHTPHLEAVSRFERHPDAPPAP
jgi:23S rRNA (uracil1939-C5)-methyltransferase